MPLDAPLTPQDRDHRGAMQFALPSGEAELRAVGLYRSAWRKLAQLDRFRWWLAISFVPCMAALLVVVRMSDEKLSPRLVVYSAAAWMTIYVAAIVYRNAFRCPRCGDRFFEHGQLGGTCASCGLPLWTRGVDDGSKAGQTGEASR